MSEENPTPEADDFTAGVLDVDSVFVVYIKDGEPIGTNVVHEVLIEHEGTTTLVNPKDRASLDDMWRGVSEVKRDLEAQRTASITANYVIQGQMQMAQQMAQQAEAQKIAQKTGLTVPGR